MKPNPYQSPVVSSEPQQSTARWTEGQSIAMLFLVSSIAVALGEAVLLFSAIVYGD
jgi:Na+-transporting NADH:ubiquinone oxidoreductase subunit NqrB